MKNRFNHVQPVLLPQLKTTSISGKRYYITPEGNTYPSITTILGHKEKSWLEAWRNMLGDEKANKEQKRTADRGENIHKLIEIYLNNFAYPEMLRGYNSEYIAGFNQIKMRLNNINNIHVQEAALYSDKLKVAGRVDCIGEYEGKLSIIDFKTSNNNKDKTTIEDYFLQCTGYALMWYERTTELIDDIVIIMSVEKGIVPLVFKEKIDKYIESLIERIKEYHREHK